jgi:hypothetical protein
MRLLKVVIALLFIASLANRYDSVFVKDASDCPGDEQFTAFDFAGAASAGIFCRENQSCGKRVNSTPRPHTALSEFACLHAPHKNLRLGSFESQYAAGSGLDERTLFSLHCLLMV